jgi:3-hydroxyisobutyrate dehydrogenase-like beta-hydroxyacid dehydrogenase
MSETLGLIGLGNMGQPIATNLLRAGYKLRVYNRTAEKAAPLVAEGAIATSHPAEVAEPGAVVFTMLADDKALEDVCLRERSFVERLGPGGIHVSMSTIAPATARRLADHHAKYKVAYVAGPVFGRPDAAAAKRLWICFSGPEPAKKRIQPILAAFTQGRFDFGEDSSAANVAKLCGNFLIAAAIEALSEALTLAEKNGLHRKQVSDMVGQTLFACPVYQGYGRHIAEHDYLPAGFRLALGLKDINLALGAAASSQTPMPLASLLRDRWLSGIAKGRADLDWSAVALGVAEDAGLKVDEHLGKTAAG